MACLNPHDPITIRIFTVDDVFQTLYANQGGGMRRDGVLVRVKRRRKPYQTTPPEPPPEPR